MSDKANRMNVYLPENIRAKYPTEVAKDIIKRMWRVACAHEVAPLSNEPNGVLPQSTATGEVAPQIDVEVAPQIDVEVAPQIDAWELVNVGVLHMAWVSEVALGEVLPPKGKYTKVSELATVLEVAPRNLALAIIDWTLLMISRKPSIATAVLDHYSE